MNERIIATVVARQIFARQCVVLVDRCNWTGHECDVLAVTRNLRLIDVEIKVTRADLKADWGKDKWWHNDTSTWGMPRDKRPRREWPHRIWKHYFAVPSSMWAPELLDFLPSPACGVVVVGKHKRWNGDDYGGWLAAVKKRAHPNRDAKPIEAQHVLDIARLANLRMWDAYGALAAMQEATK